MAARNKRASQVHAGDVENTPRETPRTRHARSVYRRFPFVRTELRAVQSVYALQVLVISSSLSSAFQSHRVFTLPHASACIFRTSLSRAQILVTTRIVPQWKWWKKKEETKRKKAAKTNKISWVYFTSIIGFLSLFFFFSGELTKFNMFPKGETLHCLKVSNFLVCAVSLLYCINLSECRLAYYLCSSSKRRVIIITLSGIVAHFAG